MITAIAFDWGGVFTEGTFDDSAIGNLADYLHLPAEEVSKIYLPLMAELEVGAFDMSEFVERFQAACGVAFDRVGFHETFLGSVQERLEMFAVLQAIPERYTVGMLSNNIPILCDRVRQDPRLQRIEHFIFSNEIGVRKPDPRAFERLGEALGASPEATLFVDDNLGNIEAGRRLGFNGLHLENFLDFLSKWRLLLPELPLDLAPGD